SGMGRAMHAFDEGRYPDAAFEFRQLESDTQDWSPGDRARYALYRGLTHLSCGDARGATRWIGSAKRAYDRDPNVFVTKEQGRLLAAWRSMGLMPGERVE